MPRRCGAKWVPVSGLSASDRNARYCRVLPMCAAGSAPLAQDGRRVSVGFSDGSTRDYDLVVGADGIRSTVRALALTTAAPSDLDTMKLARHCFAPPRRLDQAADALRRWLHVRACADGRRAYLWFCELRRPVQAPSRRAPAPEHGSR